MTEKHYTIGEIFRDGLLKNHKGEPYTNKGTISKIVAGMKHKVIKTPWGEGKAIPKSEIEKHNKAIRY